MRLLLLAACILAGAAPAMGQWTTATVEADGSGDYPTIQAAVDAGISSINLGPGVFRGPGNRDVVIQGRATFIQGHVDSSVIDCEGSADEPHRAFDVRDLLDEPIFNYFTIINGYHDEGGAIRAENVDYFHCAQMLFAGNHAVSGGALYQQGGGFIDIVGCTFESNSADDDGGAVRADQVESSHFHALEFIGNSATRGGGIAWTGPPNDPMRGCSMGSSRFEGNTATAAGGAIYVAPGNGLGMYETFLGSNDAPTGGAIQATDTVTPFLRNTTLRANTCGGGPCVAFASGGTITETMIVGTVGGPALTGIPELTRCDLWENEGGDWTAPIADQLVLRGNISADACFCDADVSTMGICSTSPCVGYLDSTGVWQNWIGASRKVSCEDCDCGIVAGTRSSWGDLRSRFR